MEENGILAYAASALPLQNHALKGKAVRPFSPQVQLT
jgi:hypothetical protein